jgi:hypothetical protein
VPYMRLWLSLAIIGLFAVTATAAEPADTPQTRRAAAERYAKAADVPKLLRDMVDGMSPNLPIEHRNNFRTLMLQNTRAEVIEAAMVVAMVKHFTTTELNALADFYGSEVGRSAMGKFGAYMGDVMPLLQAEMARAMAEYERQRSSQKNSPGT